MRSAQRFVPCCCSSLASARPPPCPCRRPPPPYYGSRTSASDGELDLDSNAACASDQPRNENTVWPTGGAPTGTYIVRLDYWDSCDAVQTDYVVTVWVKGQEPKVFSGTFTGLGERGGLGSGIDITTFTR